MDTYTIRPTHDRGLCAWAAADRARCGASCDCCCHSHSATWVRKAQAGTLPAKVVR